jgi:hypothetical protein
VKHLITAIAVLIVACSSEATNTSVWTLPLRRFAGIAWVAGGSVCRTGPAVATCTVCRFAATRSSQQQYQSSHGRPDPNGAP